MEEKNVEIQRLEADDRMKKKTIEENWTAECVSFWKAKRDTIDLMNVAIV